MQNSVEMNLITTARKDIDNGDVRRHSNCTPVRCTSIALKI